ncbi:hypothetical protein KEM09_06265 [Carboxylicivirga mesophila]|uniref:HTH luxR-type domain-containing protein n=1 Tax=Carboxylicivirga mesophila TaxID=1166478 RepID=A0ABS5K7P8_9BACT|nr:hypothetical protein [Carboxylicivirga mesophila]MBS2210995.1 hypothetical protein [Carboxylicivirga mesophila]
MKTYNSRQFVLRFLILIAILLGSMHSKCEDFVLRRKAIVYNFSKNEYKAANQNWAITQNAQGELFFGNTFGLLHYDGYNWRMHKLKDQMAIRSVFADNDGKIYIGGHEEFGYWQYNNIGELLYHSVSSTLPSSHYFKNEDIWSITKIDGKIYFRSFARIYVLNNDKITVIDPNNSIFTFHEIKGVPYIFLMNKGFHRITNDFLLEKDFALAEFDNFNVTSTIEIGDSLIIATDKKGLYLKVRQTISKWNCEANQLLKDLQINQVLYHSRQIVVGTISDGVYIFSEQGKLISHYNKSNGLQNNTVLKMLFDSNHKLWIALDKGIDLIDLEQAVDLYEDETGTLGSVYSSAVFNKRLYLGTNHGIFSTPWPPNTKNKLPIHYHTNTKGQCWNIYNSGNQLLFGHNDGTFSTGQPELEKVSPISGGAGMTINPSNGLLYQCTYIGIAIYQKNPKGLWVFHKMLQNTSSPLKFLEFDYEGNLWASHLYKHLFRYKLNTTGDTIINTDVFGKQQGFFSNYDINVFKIDKRIVFTNNGQLFTYDDISKKIIPYRSYEKQLEDYARARLIYELPNQEYWFAKNSGFRGFRQDNDSLISIGNIQYSNLKQSAVDLFENISKLESNQYLLGLEDGFCICNIAASKGNEKQLMHLKIRSAQAFGPKGDVQALHINNQHKVSVPHNHNNLKIELSAPGIYSNSVKFYYSIDQKGNWKTVNSNILELNNLNWGSYNISLKAIDEHSNMVAFNNYSFRINRPLMLHPLIIIVYFIIAGLLIVAFRRITNIRIKQQKLIYLKKLKQQNEAQIIKMNNQLLQSKVADKSKELASYTMLLKRKNEVLTELKYEIEQLELSKTKSNLLTKAKAIKIINSNLSDKNDLEAFNLHFNEGYDNFIVKLKQKHPEITPNDMRLCAFLRMNLATKEIAVLLNLSPRSVEVKRYRLRKKLGLATEDNLTNYLMEF